MQNKKILLWIDIQYDYYQYCNYIIEKLNSNDWINYLKQFDNVIFILDETNWNIQNEFSDNNWLLIYNEDENYIWEYTKYINKVIYKEYWFFRELMDLNEFDNEEIINIFKIFYDNNYQYYNQEFEKIDEIKINENNKKYNKEKVIKKLKKIINEKWINEINFFFL